jgi:hypothetical protein
MKKCAACKSIILMGGATWGAWTICSDRCLPALKQALTRQMVPANDIEQQTETVHRAVCVMCKGPGPNDVYFSKRLTGMLVAVQWSTERHLCCSSCAKSKKLRAALHCLFLGWWSPKALFLNLYFLPYNLISALAVSPTQRPTRHLTEVVMEIIATNNAARFAQLAAAKAAS